MAGSDLSPEPAVSARRFLALLPFLPVLVACLTFSRPLSGQAQPLCVEGCNDFSVVVTPDWGTTSTKNPYAPTEFIQFFTVWNNGINDDTYGLSCASTAPATCDSVQPSSLSLAAGAQNTKVKAYFHVGAAGTGRITLHADGEASDTGWVSVPVVAPPGAPVISLAPYSPGNRSVGQCLASCFDMVWTHSTVPYFSLGQPRTVSLVYNSATVHPKAVIAMDLNATAGHTPTSYSLQVKRVSTGAFLTLLNGQQAVYYMAQGTTPVRVEAVLDDSTNGLTTGGYDVLVVATAHYGTDSTISNTVPSYVLVNDRGKSAFGAGVGMAGLQQVFSQSDGVVVVEGDGSVLVYKNGAPPAGVTTTLATVGGHLRRVALDGSYVEFLSNGRMSKAVDRFGNTTTLTWGTAPNDTLLVKITDPMGKRDTLTYASGKLATVKDPGNRVTTYTITSGRLVNVKDPDNISTVLAYNTSTNQLTQVTDRAGHATNITYDALGRVDSLKAPSVPLYTGGNGRPTVVLKAADRVVWQPGTTGTSEATAKTAQVPDSALATATDPQGAVITFRLDRLGAPIWIKDVFGKITTITRDTLSRPTYVTEPNGHASQFSYSNGNEPPAYSPYLLLQAKDLTTNRTLNYTYTALGDVATITGGPAGVSYTYHSGTGGPAGSLDSVQIAGAFGGRYLEDTRGRVTVFIHADSAHRDSTLYEGTWGNVATQVDARGNRITYHYDALGRADTTHVPQSGTSKVTYGVLNQTLTSMDGRGYTTSFGYDSLGNLVRVTDPKHEVYKFRYNPLGWLTAQHDLGDTTKADSTWYDVAGNVRTVKTRRGDTITLTYDVAGRLLTRSGPDFPADTFRYDPAGRWLVGKNAVAYDSLAYDAAGRLTTSIQTMSGHTYQWNYTWDSQNRITARSDPGNNYPVSAGYSGSNGTLTSLTAPGGHLSPTYNQERLATTLTFGPGTPSTGQWTETRTFTKNHADSLQAYSNSALNNLLGVTVTYDSLNRLKTQQYNGELKRAFTYDSLGRLTNACDLSGPTCTNEWGWTGPAYVYDSAGNRLVAGELVANVGAGNRLAYSAGWYFTYDANGNMVSKCSGYVYCYIGQQYTWDALGRLKQVLTGPGAFVDSFAYDPFGRRVRKTTASGNQWYVYDGDQVALDLNNSFAVTNQYGHLPGSDRLFSIKNASWSGVVLTDPVIGSVHGIARDSAGAPLKKYDLNAWGRIASPDTGVVTRFRMAGREYDPESGLYYMRARYYDPELGRFLTEDPIGIMGGLNLYAYSGNDPISGSDPFGMDPKCDEGVVCLPEIEGYAHHDLPSAFSEPQACNSDQGSWTEWQWTTCGGFTPREDPNGNPIVSTSGAGAGSPPKPGDKMACRDAVLIAIGTGVIDGSFFFTGGLSGIFRGARAAGYVARSLTEWGTKMDLVYARGNLIRGGRSLASAYLGSRGALGATAIGFDAAAPSLAGGFSVGGFLRSLVPGLATYDAVMEAVAACRH